MGRQKTERYRADFDGGMSLNAIAEKHGVHTHTVSQWARTHGLWRNGPRGVTHSHGGKVDNAVTAAFREVFGWCPFRDSSPKTGKKPLPKGIVETDPIDRRVHRLPTPAVVGVGE